MRRKFCLAGLCLIGILASGGVRAADEDAAGRAGKGRFAELSPKEWKSLIARRDALMQESVKLEQEFATADANAKQKIQNRLQEMEAEFRGEIEPKIRTLALAVNEKDPTDPDAAGVAALKAYQDHKFSDALAIAQKALDRKPTMPLLAFKAQVQFTINDFDGALATLAEAKKLDPKEYNSRFTPLAESAAQYAKYWKEEQAIRAKEAKADDLPRVVFKTSRGDIVMELFENEAPNTVANFISLVENKEYDGTKFHRVIPLFMAQGGDPNSLDADPNNDGQGGPGYTIPCECYSDKARKHFQGSVSMAHAGKDTGGSQFFLTHYPTSHLNYEEGKDQSNHTVFGRIIKGLEVSLAVKKGDKIESAKVLRKRDHEYVPEKSGAKRGSGKKPRKPEVSIE